MNTCQMSVSILTPTQYSRKENLLNLLRLVKHQDYKNIIQWVIINGTKHKSDADLYKHFIKHNIIDCNPDINITYVDWEPNRTFAKLFNDGNNNCIGDYIAIMEDDEYYFSCHISNAIQQLNNSDAFISGCSSILSYNMVNKTMYKFISFGKYHSCNHAFVYKKEYLMDNKYTHNPENPFAIEPSFTNNFTNKLIQLDPYKSVIHIFHEHNTFHWSTEFDNWVNKNICVPINMYNDSTFEDFTNWLTDGRPRIRPSSTSSSVKMSLYDKLRKIFKCRPNF